MYACTCIHMCMQIHMHTQTCTCVYICVSPDISVFLTMFCL